MNKYSKNQKRFFISTIIIIIIVSVLYYEHQNLYSIPKTRIALNENYPDMKEDNFHHYINLPIDYNDQSKGLFRGFYLLSPNFYKSKNITLLLTDGQMELVSTDTDFDFFESVLKENSYVLIGVRGNSPTFFPEVYKNNNIDYDAAMNLYGSDQQVEDIERVRLDLIKKGYLKKEDKINLFGASGAGILVQQYLSKYGKNVNRVILESTGAPDISRKLNLKYSSDFKEFNPKASNILDSLLKKNAVDKEIISNILYQKGRADKSPKASQIQILEKLQQGESLWSYKFKPVTNISILNYMVKSSKEIAARVRWFELVGYDLMNYDSKKGINLLYEISGKTLSDILDFYKKNNRSAKKFTINRESFLGEVLLLKGTEDVVFSDAVNIEIQKSYLNSKLLFFIDGHKMQNNKAYYQKIRNTFLAKGLKSDDFLNLIKTHK